MFKSSSVPSAQDYLERARMYYHDQNAEKARNYFEKVRVTLWLGIHRIYLLSTLTIYLPLAHPIPP